jgi:hypothetical protein
MPQNFLSCDRDQALLLPPSLDDWLSEGHLARFVLDTVAELDLVDFYRAYRLDGHGRAAFEPEMMACCLCTRTRLGCARHGRSSGAALTMLRSGGSR